MTHHLQCQCGALQGELSQPQQGVRGVCYCKDCRAYTQHLGRGNGLHDALGGVEFVATLAKQLRFTRGAENLVCLSLSDKGLLRWHAKCCNTPIGSTLRNWRVPYVGLTHACLSADPAAFERAFPRIQMRVNTASAKAPPPAMRLRTGLALGALISRVMSSRFTGSYRQTPFFSSPTGSPVFQPIVLTREERQRATRLGQEI